MPDCTRCIEEREAAGLEPRFAEERYSFGIYAGRYCDHCWPLSGYPDARFSELDAGERMEPLE